MKGRALFARFTVGLLAVLGLFASSAEASVSASLDVSSIKGDPFAALPQLTSRPIAERLAAVEQNAVACAALCELAASIDSDPLGYGTQPRPFGGLATPFGRQYFYASANPTMFVDPTGHESVLPHLVDRDKAGDVAAFKANIFKKDPGRFSDDLEDAELAYLKALKGTPFQSSRLSETQIAEARTLFGSGEEALQKYSNYANRGQLITRHAFADPKMRQYVTEIYRLTRDTNLLHMMFERGHQMTAGQELLTGESISRWDAFLEFGGTLVGMKLIQQALAAIRPPTTKSPIGAELDQAEVEARALAGDRLRASLNPNAKGDLAKSWSRSAAIARGDPIVGEEVDLIFTIDGKRVGVRADVLTRPAGSTMHVYIEAKFSGRASYTDGQKVVIPELVASGDSGLVAEVGARAGTLQPGRKIRVVFQGDVWDAKPTLKGEGLK